MLLKVVNLVVQKYECSGRLLQGQGHRPQKF